MAIGREKLVDTVPQREFEALQDAHIRSTFYFSLGSSDFQFSRKWVFLENMKSRAVRNFSSLEM